MCPGFMVPSSLDVCSKALRAHGAAWSRPEAGLSHMLMHSQVYWDSRVKRREGVFLLQHSCLEKIHE